MEDLEFNIPKKEGQKEITKASEITKLKDSLSPSSTEQIETETGVPGESQLTNNSCSLQVITKLSASTALDSPVDPTISNGDASKNLNNSPVENPDRHMERNGQPTNTTGAAEKSDEGERGYDYELVNTEKESEEMCPICCLIPRKPQKVECCGYIFCRNCINAEKSCPLCRTDNFRSMRDRKCERKIESLKVHCPNHNKGCKWTGELRNVEEHLKKDPTTSRKVRVRGCRYQLSLCTKCEETVMYNRMKTHLEEDCNHRTVACEFESVGCDFSGPKYQMLNHIQDDMLQHLSLVTRFVKQNEDHIEKLERNNSSPRPSPEVKSNVYVVISVGIVLVSILAAILIRQKIKEADLDMKLTDYGLQLNNLHDVDDDIHKEMEEQKKKLSKCDKVHQEILEQRGEISHLKYNFKKDAKELKKIQRIKEADLDRKLTDYDIKLNDLKIKLNLLKQDVSDLRKIVEGIERFSVKSIYDIIKKFLSNFLPEYISDFLPKYIRTFFPKFLQN